MSMLILLIKEWRATNWMHFRNLLDWKRQIFSSWDSAGPLFSSEGREQPLKTDKMQDTVSQLGWKGRVPRGGVQFDLLRPESPWPTHRSEAHPTFRGVGGFWGIWGCTWCLCPLWGKALERQQTFLGGTDGPQSWCFSAEQGAVSCLSRFPWGFKVRLGGRFFQ